MRRVCRVRSLAGALDEPAAIEAEIAHLRSLALDALRQHWRVSSPESTPMATLSYGGIFGDNSGGATPQRHRPSTRPSRVGRMNGPVGKLARCAIYTRSTEYNLELAFNSLDAQREACEAYIKSQAHEGWRLIPGRYDDGAFSGASLDRPALQQLLAEVRPARSTLCWCTRSTG
jgi:hypothetical protein